jgi:hypothetical protein
MDDVGKKVVKKISNFNTTTTKEIKSLFSKRWRCYDLRRY